MKSIMILNFDEKRQEKKRFTAGLLAKQRLLWENSNFHEKIGEKIRVSKHIN
jgi:hypothetical protein